MIFKKLFFVFSILGLAIFAVISLKFFPQPWIYISLSLSACVFVTLKLFKSNKIKIFLTNICIFFALMAPIEFLAFHLTKKAPNGKTVQIFDISGNRPFVVRDSNLGYIPYHSTVFKHTENYSDGSKNSVHYSINENGLRISMPKFKTDNKYLNSVLFFGCSLTFGEMVEDYETLPWQFSELDGHSRKIYNFGFEGYGPHHMLASLQRGRVGEIVSEEPNLIIFQGIDDHLDRITHDHAWIKNGPRYLIEDGDLVRKGNFSAHGTYLLSQLKKSSIFNLLKNSKYTQRSFNEKAQLFVKIIKESRDILLNEYDQVQFIVLMWPDFKYSVDENRLLVDLMTSEGIEVIEVKNILTDVQKNWLNYVVPNNGHPNRLAFEKISQFLFSYY